MSRNPTSYASLLQESRRQREHLVGRRLASPPTPLAVTGATGVAGYGALAYFQARFRDVYAVVQESDGDFPADNLIRLDLRDYRALEREFDRLGIRAILDCAGNCALKACQLDPRIAWDLNVEIAKNLAQYAATRRIRLVHLSVDMVFGGRAGGGYRESEPVCPVNVYGRTMAAGELEIAEICPDAVTLRISMPMGISYNGHAGAIDWIASRFRPGRAATLYYDEVRTPTYVDEMARVFHEFLVNDYSGVLHCGGSRQVSLYEMAQIINRSGGFSPDLLFGMLAEESCPVPPRVRNCSLDSSELTRVLGYAPFTPWPGLDYLVPTGRKWHYDRSENEEGSTPYMNRTLGCSPSLYDSLESYLDKLI